MSKRKEFARFTLRLVIAPYFHALRVLRHSLFLELLGSDTLKPSVASAPFRFIYRAIHRVTKLAHEEFTSFALQQYSRSIPKHYSKDGLAYFKYDEMSEQDRLKRFESFKGRLELYLQKDAVCFGYRDGDSFLDAGCGPGQNIRVLVAHYPHSKIRGFDFSADAIQVVMAAAEVHSNIQVEQGSLLDFAFLGTLADGSYDHVIMSHVFAVLISNGTLATRQLRQRVIDELVRISGKSILLMDGIYQLNQGEYWVNIEQRDRCIFVESLAPYFDKHLQGGSLKMLFSKENSALFFEKKR